MTSDLVWVELVAGNPVRIFRQAPHLMDLNVARMPRAEATKKIRDAVFARSGGECEFCAKPLTLRTMHMHEKQFRGKGGEISIYNSVAICFDCHLGRPDAEHGNRRPRFGESESD